MYKKSNLEFDKDRKRVKDCPCGKSNNDGKFVPYKGYDDKGYCFSCDETFLPSTKSKTVGTTHKNSNLKQNSIQNIPPSFIPRDLVVSSLTRYDQNKFIVFLNQLVGIEATEIAIKNYLIGTTPYSGRYSTIFWQMSKDGNRSIRVRSGKIIEYRIITCPKSFIGRDCKRVKTNIPPVRWVHKDSCFSNFVLKQCLFGEHLLNESTKPVAITESEKSAVIASIYLPQFIWLAAGSLTNLKLDRCKVLEGRKVILFPDLNGFETWTKKAKELSSICEIKVSDLLDKKASFDDRQLGLDLADYLIRMDYNQFKKN